MAVLPFGLWDVGETFNQAVDFEQEEEEQYEVEDVTKKCQFTVMHEECNMYVAYFESRIVPIVEQAVKSVVLLDWKYFFFLLSPWFLQFAEKSPKNLKKKMFR